MLSGNFMQDWLTVVLAALVGFAPFGCVYSIITSIFGKEAPPTGLAAALLVVILLLLIAAIPLAIWTYMNFQVMWRP